MKTHLVVPLAVTMMLCACIPVAKADTEFDYVGNNFSYCYDATTGGGNSSCFGGRVTGDFVTPLTGSALDNLSMFPIISPVYSADNVTGFDFSDGLGLELDKGNTDQAYIYIWTDAEGQLTQWELIIRQVFGARHLYQNDLEILSAPADGAGTDLVNRCYDGHNAYCTTGDTVNYESFPQGIWSEHSVNVPEPGSLSLFGVSLVGASAMRRRKAKRV